MAIAVNRPSGLECGAYRADDLAADGSGLTYVIFRFGYGLKTRRDAIGQREKTR